MHTWFLARQRQRSLGILFAAALYISHTKENNGRSHKISKGKEEIWWYLTDTSCECVYMMEDILAASMYIDRVNTNVKSPVNIYFPFGWSMERKNGSMRVRKLWRSCWTNNMEGGRLRKIPLAQNRWSCCRSLWCHKDNKGEEDTRISYIDVGDGGDDDGLED